MVTASDTVRCDVGIRDGRIAALGRRAGTRRRRDRRHRQARPARRRRQPLPHRAAVVGRGVMCADDFYSGTVSAAFGGTTTIIPFAAQHRGKSLRAGGRRTTTSARDRKAVIDYAFHLIISDPTEQVLGQELPALIRDGYTSFKVYMTYDAPEAQRPPDARRPGAGAARGRAGDGPCREPRHDPWLTERLLDAAAMARAEVSTPSRTPASPRARRPTAPIALAAAARRADADRPRLGRRGDGRDPARPDAGPARSTARPARSTCS